MHYINEFWYILIISIFNYFNFQSLSQKLNLIFKFSLIKRKMNVPLWTHMGHKVYRNDRKTFITCCTIALKIWDECNASFVFLLFFSSHRSIKFCHLSKMWRKTIRQCIHGCSWLIFPKTFSFLRNILSWYWKTNLKETVHIFCSLPEWIGNI